MALKGKIVPKSNEEVKKWIVRFVVWASSGLIIFLSLIYLGIFGPIPDYEELRSIKQANATELISIDGKVLGRYFIENRVDVQFSEIPPFLIHALLATEDTRFFEHKGIDIRALFRVFFKTGGVKALCADNFKPTTGKKFIPPKIILAGQHAC